MYKIYDDENYLVSKQSYDELQRFKTILESLPHINFDATDSIDSLTSLVDRIEQLEQATDRLLTINDNLMTNTNEALTELERLDKLSVSLKANNSFILGLLAEINTGGHKSLRKFVQGFINILERGLWKWIPVVFALLSREAVQAKLLHPVAQEHINDVMLYMIGLRGVLQYPESSRLVTALATNDVTALDKFFAEID